MNRYIRIQLGDTGTPQEIIDTWKVIIGKRLRLPIPEIVVQVYSDAGVLQYQVYDGDEYEVDN